MASPPIAGFALPKNKSSLDSAYAASRTRFAICLGDGQQRKREWLSWPRTLEDVARIKMCGPCSAPRISQNSFLLPFSPSRAGTLAEKIKQNRHGNAGEGGLFVELPPL
jgi:hypothetical protein